MDKLIIICAVLSLCACGGNLEKYHLDNMIKHCANKGGIHKITDIGSVWVAGNNVYCGNGDTSKFLKL